MNNSYKRLKIACYSSNISMSVVGNLPPLLFLTFREMYGLSYTLLGLLVLINFVTQLVVDLIFSFFSHKFNIPGTVRLMPVLTVTGLLIYGLSPFVFPDFVYLGLVIGTVVFSAAAGLGEVLISPIIGAIPAKAPDREMSKLHSVYAWGVVGVIAVSSVFIFAFGSRMWQALVLAFALIPLFSAVMFAKSKIPTLQTGGKTVGVLKHLKNKKLWMSVFAIFLGGAAECTMAQWCSGYLEKALGIDKLWGDILGVAMFAVMLGLGRTLYAKRGKNICRVITLGAVGAVACYFLSAVTDIPALGILSCALCGICVSMLWPGNLVIATERIPNGGVFIYAMMAVGGDLGASVGPQLVGVITDKVIESEKALPLAKALEITTEQLGMKAGMLVGMLFPLAAVFLYLVLWKGTSKRKSL